MLWQAVFTRGYHFNLYDLPFENPDAEGPDWQLVRRNVGQTVTYARQMDLADAAPHGDLASTGFCLAKPGDLQYPKSLVHTREESSGAIRQRPLR